MMFPLFTSNTARQPQNAWSFTYDTLNRLATANATWPDSSQQYACWNYDDFGNRVQQEMSSAAFTSGSGGPTACTAQSGATLATNLATYSASNQIVSTNARGVSVSPMYDAAGDMSYDGTNQYLYDAEGRVCAVQSTSMPGMTSMTGYLYDADGARVAKGTITSMSCDPSANGFQFTENYVLGPGDEELTIFSVASGVANWQRTNVYAAGILLATYDAAGLHFHLTDPLGTRRMQLSGEIASLGQPETDFQSLPFGDQLNTFPDRYAPASADDSTPLHFTGKERDTESGNDYFGARYYASSMGRFMSPDWSAKVTPVPYAKLSDPQSLNLYAYVGNNPMTRFDPDGHFDCTGKNAQGAGCQYIANWNKEHGIDPSAKKSNAPGVPVKLPNGKTVPDPHSPTGVMMAPSSSVSDVAAAGKNTGNTVAALNAAGMPGTAAAVLVTSLGTNVGTGGNFDEQRMGPQSDVLTGGFQQLPQFRDASNFNVGLFSQQAGMTLDQTLQTAGDFARGASSNYSPNQPYGLAPQTAEFIRVGYQAGATAF
jgi:RHS repeat-associated protein